jgi:hypothetical protein
MAFCSTRIPLLSVGRKHRAAQFALNIELPDLGRD